MLPESLRVLGKEIAGRLVPPSRVLWCIRKRGFSHVALTFDDGPHPIRTQRLLKLLEDLQVKATFFVWGSRAEKRPDLLREIIAAGHELANHSYDHDDMRQMTRARLLEEIRKTDECIDAAGGKSCLFRPPYGYVRWRYVPHIWKAGKTLVFWSVDSRDHQHPSTEQMLEYLNPGKLRGGDVILFHDGYEFIYDALATIVEQLRERKLEFATVSDMIARAT